MSTYIEGKALRQLHMGRKVDTASLTVPQTAETDLFDISGGRVLVLQILGEIDTVMGAVATNIRLRHTPTGGAAGNLCADRATANDAAGAQYGITGTVATALQYSVDAILAQATPQILLPGAISWITNANNTGACTWSILYVPIDDGAEITAA